MTDITLYGDVKSRAIRSIWALEECRLETGIDYTHVKLKSLDEMRSPDFLAINPNGKIPALVDGDVVLFESMCINLYLAQHYAKSLLPGTAKGETYALRWSFWAISEVEPLQMDLLNHTRFLPKPKRIAQIAEVALKKLGRPMAVSNTHLRDNAWLVGDGFSIADLNLSAVMLLLQMASYDYDDWPHVKQWLDKCYARDALMHANKR